MQAGDRFRCSGEGPIAGGREPSLAGLDELDLVRVQAAHGSHGQLTAGSFLGSYSFQGTDFIFAVAGEELGFVGCATIVVLLGLVIFRAVRIAARADDAFGLLVASGIAVWFAAQAFINIGMTIGIAPVTGLPLPFVSYGGSALFADMIAVGVLQSIHRRHRVFS